jgi:drug/metabolite transporter superfamily protein YnfA
LQLFVVLGLLPLLAYCVVQAVRDARRRHYVFAAWGGAMVLYIAWAIEVITRGPSY